MPALVWLRRDLRRSDLPLLAEAAAGDGRLLVLFVLDPQFWDDAGSVRQAWLARTLLALRGSFEGRLCLRRGGAVDVVPQVARVLGATSVHVSTETEPAGAMRDAAVRDALSELGVAWVETGSPYAVTPGRIRSTAGGPFQVFSPFARAWREHGWRGPAVEPANLTLLDHSDTPGVWDELARVASSPDLPDLPPAGEAAAQERWADFLDEDLDGYAEGRDRADLDSTSRMSPYLKFGVVHPRTLLADLETRSGPGVDRFVTELAWREFYADVLHHHPDSLTADLRDDLSGLGYDHDPELLQEWQQGRTGYPFVDAGMRQLLATGWMHNRLRMITASFLTKDLHHWWREGADWFEQLLVDADLASNTHGWQWTAGTGTDASPYFRVFNPVLQGQRFDPQGDYVRRWVPELRHVEGAAAHEPWTVADGYVQGYPERLVDHAEERKVALARLKQAKAARKVSAP